jgi:glycosyltransferase involved in cell wall biosynthesis/O-antigen/teichoic acid export membrane protein
MKEDASPVPGANNPATAARACLVAEKFFPDSRGGMELHAYQLAQQLIENGAEAFAVTRFQRAQSPADEFVGRVRVHRLKPVGLLEGRAWRALLPNLAALRGFFAWLVQHWKRYDVILVHSTKFLLAPVLLAAWLRGRAVVVKVDTLLHLQQAISRDSLAKMRLPGLRLLASLWSRCRAALLRRADAVVAVSEDMRSVLLRMGVAADRVHLIPNGIDTQRFSPATEAQRVELRRRLGLPADRILVMYVGRLAFSKGVLDLAEAWRTVSRAHPHAQLVLLGSGSHSGDDCEAQLHEHIHAGGVANVVTFAGEKHNVHEYLQAADVFVMPSHSEGFCLALVEAMACGLPVVSTPVGVAPELIRDRENGFLAACREPRDLARALCSALDGPERWSSLGAKARAAVASRFSMPSIARAYQTLFDSLRDQRVVSAGAPDLAAQHGGDTTLSVTRRKITGNAFWLIACRVAADVLSLGLFIAISRSLGPAGAGAYSYGFAVATFVYVIGSLGIDEYGVREYLRILPAERRRFMEGLLGLQICTLLVVLVALLAYLLATGASPRTFAIVATLSAYQFASAVARCLFVPAVANQAMVGPAVAELLCRSTAILITVVALLLGLSLAAALAGFALSAVAVLSAGAASLRRHVGPVSPRFAQASLVSTVAALGAFAGGELMVQTFNRVGLIALSLSHGEVVTGLYAAALKFVEVACLPLAFVGAAAYPRLSALAVADRERFLKLSRLFWAVVILACGLVPWGLYFVAPVVLEWALGDSFTPSAPILAGMVGVALLLLLEVPLVRLLLACNLQVERLKAITAGVIVTVLLNAALVPRLGIPGAVIAFTASLLVVDALYVIVLCRRLEPRSIAQPLAVLAVSLAGALTSYWTAVRIAWPIASASLTILAVFLLIAVPLLRSRALDPPLRSSTPTGPIARR